MNNIIETIISNLTEEMKIAMSAGCELEHEYKDGKYTIKTKYPIGIVRQKDGKIIVYENRGSFDEIPKATLEKV